ncbi:MAG TPA: hypothetical protein VKN18_24305 [Blastocatellia bacterium]|nr:hypothetical protein [Blastocatellia bacterium]
MRKLSLVFGIIVMLAGVSVHAQRTIEPAQGSGPIRQNIIIQDDEGGGYFSVDGRWGTYVCNLCEYGVVLKGVAEIKVDGCFIYVTDSKDGYRMFGAINMCDQAAKFSVEVFDVPTTNNLVPPGGFIEYWFDSNLKNNVEECTKK